MNIFLILYNRLKIQNPDHPFLKKYPRNVDLSSFEISNFEIYKNDKINEKKSSKIFNKKEEILKKINNEKTMEEDSWDQEDNFYNMNNDDDINDNNKYESEIHIEKINEKKTNKNIELLNRNSFEERKKKILEYNQNLLKNNNNQNNNSTDNYKKY